MGVVQGRSRCCTCVDNVRSQFPGMRAHTGASKLFTSDRLGGTCPFTRVQRTGFSGSWWHIGCRLIHSALCRTILRMDSVVIAAAIGVGGTVVVGVSGFWASVRNTRQTIASAKGSRIWEWRARAYADYGYAVKNVFELCKRLAAYRGLPTRSKSIDPAEALEELGRLATERTAKWESVLLLGNAETIALARIWHRNVWHMELFARGERNDPSEWATLLVNVADARTRFYDAARRDLDVKGGSVPMADRWEVPPSLVAPADSSSELISGAD